ncbi:gliding motility-associated C-terminal domain-containing protein [Solitalea longa]|uniref:gliding motility-associated C-terminal domain-containing protein n=1 Tax=Solitalea longa TaxID=2079460 RepID=UPI001056F79D|nr:gliding motility-associated C-terminal domain-containing protein [Solitalea longa]
MKKLYLAAILTLLSCLSAYADTFIVTSNADAGPGTLREAIEKATANGTEEMDYIHFNLPDVSETGRTIIVEMEFPRLSSNLTIDASTQPGSKFGVSDAKVKLVREPKVYEETFVFRAFHCENIAFYSLFFEYAGNTSSPREVSFTRFTNALSGTNFIDVHFSKNIIIGGPFKGNLMSKASTSISIGGSNTESQGLSDSCRNIKIQSNIIDLTQNGNSYAEEFLTNGISVGDSFDVLIGGELPQERNIIASQVTANPYSYGDVIKGTIQIIGNFIGTDYSGKNKSSTEAYPACISVNSFQPSKTVNVLIKNNVVANGSIGISVFNINGDIIIKGNYVGTDISQSIDLGNLYDGITVSYCNSANIQIGGDNIEDGNIIAFTKYKALNISTLGLGHAKILNNKIYCNGRFYPIYDDLSYELPFIKIETITTNEVKGTATPNAKIDLYYTDKCCRYQPETYFASTVADNQGNWVYNGIIISLGVTGSATFNSSTSEFNTPPLLEKDFSFSAEIDNCNPSPVAIQTLHLSKPMPIKWYNSKGELISTDLNATNLNEGKYTIVTGDPCVQSNTYEIKSNTPANQYYSSENEILPPTCGQKGRIILGFDFIHYDPNICYFYLKNSKGDIIQSTEKYGGFSNVDPGEYSIIITRNNCSIETEKLIVPNEVPSLSINSDHVRIQNTVCGYKQGYIKGLIFENMQQGLLTCEWRNEAGEVVSHGIYLENAPSGKYQLTIQDIRGCTPVKSEVFIIENKGEIKIDYSSVKITNTSCKSATGSIKNISASGVSRYEWLTESGTVVSSQLELDAAPEGRYKLKVYNSTYGCFDETPFFEIIKEKGKTYQVSVFEQHKTTCGRANGSITIKGFVSDIPAAFKWTDAQGNLISQDQNLTNVTSGTYHYYVYSPETCETDLGTFSIESTPPVLISQNSLRVTADFCDFSNGSIKNIKVSGGTPPYAYTWKNDKGETISDKLDLVNVVSGNYTLTVKDDTGCEAFSNTINIAPSSIQLTSPLVNNVTLCSPGTAVFVVRNTENGGTYKVYESPISSAPIAQSANGILTIGKVEHDQTYFVSFSKGSCESERTEVKVSLTSDAVQVSNVFTPNGDGKNEVWEIGNMQQNPSAEISVFNRYGQMVFHSIGYHTPFDGTYKSQKLPSGTYYYVIHLKADCPAVVGPLTIIR